MFTIDTFNPGSPLGEKSGLAELGRARIERDGKHVILARNPALRHIATATVATVATVEGKREGSVARVAGVAVAASQNAEIERGEL